MILSENIWHFLSWNSDQLWCSLLVSPISSIYLLIYFMCFSVCLCKFMWTMFMQEPTEATSLCLLPWNCSYRQFSVIMWVLQSKPVSSEEQLEFITAGPFSSPSIQFFPYFYWFLFITDSKLISKIRVFFPRHTINVVIKIELWNLKANG